MCPSITTCECNRQAAPKTTCSPTTQYGPISHSAPISALGCTTAVGWIFISRFSEHEGHFRLADDLSLHRAHPFRLADLASQLGDFHINHQHVTRDHGFTPLHIISGH